MESLVQHYRVVELESVSGGDLIRSRPASLLLHSHQYSPSGTEKGQSARLNGREKLAARTGTAARVGVPQPEATKRCEFVGRRHCCSTDRTLARWVHSPPKMIETQLQLG